MELDSGTFGDSKCASDLANILTKLNNKKYTSKVGRLLARYNLGLKEFAILDKTRDTICRIWTDKHLMSINKSNLPTNVKSFTSNLIITKYRQDLKLYYRPKNTNKK